MHVVATYILWLKLKRKSIRLDDYCSKRELEAWADYKRGFGEVAPEDLVDEDFSFESGKQFDDGRGNNFDPSWKDRVLNAKVPESEIGFKTYGDWAVVG